MQIIHLTNIELFHISFILGLYYNNCMMENVYLNVTL